ncbi:MULTISPECIES: hypothetical protein [Calothrix]|uniref:Uncharacterized protein n=2 Tax=Calothrix TaxID=1186 RepID=A0ABR8A998_9CYAN|nr:MULTISPECIES: hypothetical protein [Calothrix]MBD2196566.1 hypothetical protein [Calothrix parietina FACHB-288]MBD2227406.1 hypothetical protein [Calothrix anomala FACHB-343]
MTVIARTLKLIQGTRNTEMGTLKLIPGTLKLIQGTRNTETGTLKLIQGTLKLISGTLKLIPGTLKLLHNKCIHFQCDRILRECFKSPVVGNEKL